MKGKNVRVILAFPRDFFDGLTQPPMVMRPGDELVVKEKPTEEWPAFVLVANSKGETGWVPERYLRRNGDKAIAIKRYDTMTLSPNQGEVLKVIEEDIESGWLWCEDISGRQGWFAKDHLEPI